MAPVVKNPPAMQEMQKIRAQSRGQEDPLEEEMAAHSSILAWEISWAEELRAPVHGVAELTRLSDSAHTLKSKL